METYVLPVLTYTAPDAAARRPALAPLDAATRRASARASCGCAGAAFPWRTIRGEECSGYWPAGTAAFHINADIADAVRRYVAATGDDASSSAGSALELLVETARLWRSLGHHDARRALPHRRGHRPGRVHARSSTTTSSRTSWPRGTSGRPPTSCARHPERAAELGVDEEEIAGVARRGRPHGRPVRRASSACTRSPRASPATAAGTSTATRAEEYPLLLHYPVLPALPQARSSSRPTSCSRCYLLRRPLHRRAEGARLRLLRGDHGARLVAVGVHPGDRRRRGRAPRPRLRLLRARRRSIDLRRPGAQHRATVCTWRRWPAPGSSRSPGFGGMRDHGGRCSPSRRACPRRLDPAAFRLLYRGRRLARRRRPRRRPLRAAGRRAARAAAPRRALHARPRRAGHAPRAPGA